MSNFTIAVRRCVHWGLRGRKKVPPTNFKNTPSSPPNSSTPKQRQIQKAELGCEGWVKGFE